MKTLFLTAIISCAMTSATFAQSAPTTDWNGFYTGLSYGFFDETEDNINVPGSVFRTLELEGSGLGAFVGYNIQRGSLVYGGELALSGATSSVVSETNSITHGDYLDLKGRLGYATGSFLFYGILGYSTASAQENPTNILENSSGLNYGVGVDYMVSDQFFIGAEFLERRIEGDYFESGFSERFETDTRSISIRAGLSF